MMRSAVTISLATLSLGLLASAATPGGAVVITPQTVIADVNGTKITFGDFQDKRAHSLFQARDAYYHEERRVLDDHINDLLLKQQAQKEGITVDQLIDKHVKSTLPKDPSDEALHVYYEGVETKESFEALRPKILERIRTTRLERAKAAYIQSLRKNSNVVITLPPPRAEVNMANTPVLGDKSAPVMVVEFADFECPYCQQVAPTLNKLQAEYKDRGVAFAYKDTPLPMHPHAQKAAEAARCAGEQGKYWEYHHELFATKKLELADLKADARKLNLDTAAFDKCLDSGSQAEVVRSQGTQAQDLGLQGTPSFFVNGRFLSGAPSYEQLKEVIEQELAISKAQPQQTASR